MKIGRVVEIEIEPEFFLQLKHLAHAHPLNHPHCEYWSQIRNFFTYADTESDIKLLTSAYGSAERTLFCNWKPATDLLLPIRR